MDKKDYSILNYDCRKSFQKVVDSILYLEELELSIKSFNSAKILEDLNDLENSLIIYYRSIQLLGNSLLLKKFNLKSKDKNCQFKFLFEEKIINLNILEKISLISLKKNNLYYNNYSNEIELDKKEFFNIKKDILKIKSILEEKIENV